MMVIPITSPNLVTTENLEIYSLNESLSDWKAHPAIYNARPDVNAIVHVHPPYAVAFSTINQEFRPIHHYGAPFHGSIAPMISPVSSATIASS
jgi:ribulose-5-phosphate 4-epimerase/fuculose-1-phosphate aldolase